MHYSQNPVISKEILLKTLLTQAKLLCDQQGFSADLPTKTTEELHDIVIENVDDKVHALPKFVKPKIQISDAIQLLGDYLDSKSKVVREQLTPYQEELLDKANEYGIALGLNLNQYIREYDFDTLDDDVSRWEELLKESNNLGIEWEASNYDPIGLDQAIDDHNANLWREYKSLHSDILDTSRIGG